MNYSRLGM